MIGGQWWSKIGEDIVGTFNRDSQKKIPVIYTL